MIKVYQFYFSVENDTEGCWFITGTDITAPIEVSSEEEGIKLAIKYYKRLVRAYTGRKFLFGLHPHMRKAITGQHHLIFELDI